MEDHVVVSVDPLIAQPNHGGDAQGSLIEGATRVNNVGEYDSLEQEDEKEENLIQIVECRICQEDDTLQNLDVPCACSGTLKFAHMECVQLWCYEKGDTICEICHQPFKPGYTATSPVYHPGDTSIDISDDWTTSSNPLDLHDPRLLGIAAVEHQALEAEHEDYVYTSTSGTTLWQSAALILMAILLLRHAAPLFNADVEKALMYFYFFFLRAAAVILPCYLMARIIRIIQHQRQRQQTAAELAFMLQAEEQQVTVTRENNETIVTVIDYAITLIVSFTILSLLCVSFCFPRLRNLSKLRQQHFDGSLFESRKYKEWLLMLFAFRLPYKITAELFLLQVCAIRNRRVTVSDISSSTLLCLQTYKTFCSSKLSTQKDMSFLTLRGFFILVCVGILASQPCMVSGLRSKDLALRLPLVQISHTLKAVAMEDLQSKMDLAPAPSMMTFDPNQSNKRTVRKGSDPIHNRS
ncbi:hypothetical protein VNO77_42511 [Canavalia gladiata]|uniref:RING-CH-type domain-containing protein n=1 Tax=Canavalia gladiata TaxID=3824 RepID=A0AAN9JVD2_CANGL